MRFKLLSLVALASSALSFAQNATEGAAWVSPYYPLVNSPYLAGSIALLRDVTIIVVLWLVLFKKFNEKEKGK